MALAALAETSKIQHGERTPLDMERERLAELTKEQPHHAAALQCFNLMPLPGHDAKKIAEIMRMGPSGARLLMNTVRETLGYPDDETLIKKFEQYAKPPEAPHAPYPKTLEEALGMLDEQEAKILQRIANGMRDEQIQDELKIPYNKFRLLKANISAVCGVKGPYGLRSKFVKPVPKPQTQPPRKKAKAKKEKVKKDKPEKIAQEPAPPPPEEQEIISDDEVREIWKQLYLPERWIVRLAHNGQTDTNIKISLKKRFGGATKVIERKMASVCTLFHVATLRGLRKIDALEDVLSNPMDEDLPVGKFLS